MQNQGSDNDNNITIFSWLSIGIIGLLAYADAPDGAFPTSFKNSYFLLVFSLTYPSGEEPIGSI